MGEDLRYPDGFDLFWRVFTAASGGGEGPFSTVKDSEVRSSSLPEIVDYMAVSALLAGALLVNFGVMMLISVWTPRKFGGLIVAIGLGLLVMSTVVLQRESHSTTQDAPTAASVVEFRTPVVDGLTVREGPGPKFERATSIWQVNPGDRLRVIEDSLGWIHFHVKYFDPDWSGWVPRHYTTDWDTYQEIRRIQRITSKPPSDRLR